MAPSHPSTAHARARTLAASQTWCALQLLLSSARLRAAPRSLTVWGSGVPDSVQVHRVGRQRSAEPNLAALRMGFGLASIVQNSSLLPL